MLQFWGGKGDSAVSEGCSVCGAHRGLFPLQVQSSQSNHIDRYLACGENYRALRDAVGQAMIECETEALLEAEKVGPVLLALTRLWVLDGQCSSLVLPLTVSAPGDTPGLPWRGSCCGSFQQTHLCFAFSPVF